MTRAGHPKCRVFACSTNMFLMQARSLEVARFCAYIQQRTVRNSVGLSNHVAIATTACKPCRGQPESQHSASHQTTCSAAAEKDSPSDVPRPRIRRNSPSLSAQGRSPAFTHAFTRAWVSRCAQKLLHVRPCLFAVSAGVTEFRRRWFMPSGRISDHIGCDSV